MDGAHAERVVVAIATPLEPELVERVTAVDPRLEVRHAPELLPPVRFPCDHRGGDGFTRAPADERRWWDLLAGADVLFGVPGEAPAGLAAVAHRCPGCAGFRRPAPARASRSPLRTSPRGSGSGWR